jgi:hypothetical protein
MPEWQERLTRGTNSSIPADHDLRYNAAAVLIASAPLGRPEPTANGDQRPRPPMRREDEARAMIQSAACPRC